MYSMAYESLPPCILVILWIAIIVNILTWADEHTGCDDICNTCMHEGEGKLSYCGLNFLINYI